MLSKLAKISDRLLGTRLTLKPKLRYMRFPASARLQPSFAIDFLATPQPRTYVQIGEETLINARIVFEAETGLVKIGDRTNIGGATIICRERVTIGNDVMMAWGITIYDHNSNALDWPTRARMARHFYEKYGAPDCYDTIDWTGVGTGPVVIEDKVWIGLDVVILEGVRIGEGAVIGARAVVTRDVEPYTVVGGNPAQVLKRLTP